MHSHQISEPVEPASEIVRSVTWSTSTNCHPCSVNAAKLLVIIELQSWAGVMYLYVIRFIFSVPLSGFSTSVILRQLSG